MTRKLSYTRLSKSRFEGLRLLFPTPGLTVRELATRMWGGHRMALVNAKAVLRELHLSNLIIKITTGAEEPRFLSVAEAKPILENPSWICKYCSLDTTDSNKRLWGYPCMGVGCGQHHQVCRFCKKQLLKATGDFPYVVKLRGCPGTVAVTAPARPEKKKKLEEVQKEL